MTEAGQSPIDEISADSKAENTSLFVGSTFDLENKRPQLYWEYEGRQGFLSVEKAQERGAQIFKAAGIAENEAAIMRGVIRATDPRIEEPKKRKGMGLLIQEVNRQKEFDKRRAQGLAAIKSMLQMLREYREPLKDGLHAFYGVQSDKGVVQFPASWYGEELKLDVEEAIDHARALLEGAEAALVDGFIYTFMSESLEMPPQEVYPLIQEFRLYRIAQLEGKTEQAGEPGEADAPNQE